MSGPPAVTGGTRARSLTEGALLAALTVALALIMTYVPVAGGLAAFLVPTPTAVLVVRRDLRTALLSSIVAGLLLFAFLGPLGAVMGWIQIAGIGLPLGYGFRQRWAPWRTLLVTTIVLGLVALVGIVTAIYLSGFNPLDMILRSYRESGEWAWSLYGRAGVLPPGIDSREDFLAWWNSVVDAVAMLLPVGLIAGYAAFALITYALNKTVLERLGHPAPAVTPFSQWQLPGWSLYAFAAAMGLVFLLGRAEGSLAQAVATNVMYAVLLVFAVNGSACAYAFLQRWGASRRLAALLLGLAILLGLLMPLAWLGLLDVGLRLRERYGPQAGDRA